MSGVVPGPYRALFEYLDKRYANRVVLTFAEIEDLLGSTLPEQARLNPEWWTQAEVQPGHPRYSDSWLLAHRSATPSLLARRVVFVRG